MDLSPHTATQAWDDLAGRLDAFLAAWERSPESPPGLAEHLPAGPLTLRRMTLEELVKADLEQRARGGVWRSLEAYGAEFPELLVDGEPPVELMFEEYHWRRTAGVEVSPTEYLARFPRSADQLARLFELSPVRTTPLSRRREHESIEAGERLDEFELLMRVGQGAFASVFLARQTSLQRLVALKVSADRGDEPQTLAQLDHPHIVRVYDQRIEPQRRLRLLYMQFAPGGTLQEVVARVQATPRVQRTGRLIVEAVDAALQRAGQLAPERSTARRRLAASDWSETVCRLGVALAQALDYAHGEGVLHRDVKPANVLLTSDGAPKLADFNISFASTLAGAAPAAYFGGSLAYMSPEQLEACHPARRRRPEELDGRSDLYSLAVLLWELLYGERPFRDASSALGWTATLDAMLERRASLPTDPPVDPLEDRLSRRLRHVLLRTLDPRPERRPASGRQLAREIYLCTQPQAWEMLCGPRSGWSEWARRRALVPLVGVILPPNALGGAFNYWYNEQAIIAPLGAAGAEVFSWTQMAINSTLFPLGILILHCCYWPVARTLRRLKRTPPPDEDELRRRRRRALRFGHLAAGVGIVEWLAAGLLFPICLHAGLGQFAWSGYVHFFFSMSVCGAVAAAFPFFGATELSLRLYYPALLGTEPIEEDERRQVTRLASQSTAYLLVAAGVPLLGLLLLLGSGSDNRLAALVLIVVGLIGMSIAFWSHARIRRSVQALAAATRPGDSFDFDTESVDV